LPKNLLGRKLHAANKLLWKSCLSCSSAEMTHAWPTTINGQYYCANLQDMVRLAVRCKQPELLEQGVLFAPGQCNTSSPLWCAKSGATGVRRCWHIHPTFQISPHVITGCLLMWNNIFGVKDLNRNMTLTLLSLPLYIIWARMHIELQLQIGKVCGQCWWLHWVEDICINIQEYQ
jgi:hypothetical protein